MLIEKLLLQDNCFILAIENSMGQNDPCWYFYVYHFIKENSKHFFSERAIGIIQLLKLGKVRKFCVSIGMNLADRRK